MAPEEPEEADARQGGRKPQDRQAQLFSGAEPAPYLRKPTSPKGNSSSRVPSPARSSATAPASKRPSNALTDSAAAPTRPRKTEPEAAWSVGDLTRRIRTALTGMGRFRVEGEVSRIMRAASGHMYFDLKDSDAKVACVVWRGQAARAVRFELKEGTQVVAHAQLDVYAPRGGYSLIIERLEPAGVGALLLRFEELKRTLSGKGWFARQRELPSFPKRLGVVTSRDGAALQDFLRTRSLRWPGYPLRLAHSPVQGPGASQALAQAVQALAASGCDVICLVRGGGSLEDLWAFNEKPVLEAIRHSPVPVVSGVGHEVDQTLADFVADWRAHTPTDAAQMVIPDRSRIGSELERVGNHLIATMDSVLGVRIERLTRAAEARVLQDPAWILERGHERTHQLFLRLRAALDTQVQASTTRVLESARRLQAVSPEMQLERRASRLAQTFEQLRNVAAKCLDTRRERVSLLSARLEAISPLKVLARGYSVTSAEGDAAPLVSANGVRAGMRLQTRLADGLLVSEVKEVQEPSEG